jgi:hypothetical protein
MVGADRHGEGEDHRTKENKRNPNKDMGHGQKQAALVVDGLWNTEPEDDPSEWEPENSTLARSTGNLAPSTDAGNEGPAAVCSW